MTYNGCWKQSETAIETFHGNFFDLKNPRSEDVGLVDIAHHLSLINRFVGASVLPISVAVHSIVVSSAYGILHPEASNDELLAALLHDAHEAYLGNWSRPLKILLGRNFYHLYADPIRAAIHEAFGIPFESHLLDGIKVADDLALQAEADVYMTSHGRESFWKPVKWTQYCHVLRLTRLYAGKSWEDARDLFMRTALGLKSGLED